MDGQCHVRKAKAEFLMNFKAIHRGSAKGWGIIFSPDNNDNLNVGEESALRSYINSQLQDHKELAVADAA
jgi:hypothetical protein